MGYRNLARAFHIELQAVIMIGLAAIAWWLRGVAEGLERRAVMLRRHPDGTPVRVFVSYAREDVKEALGVYDWLRANGCDPWLDQRNLLPGQRWEDEIRKQITCADIFIACLSSRSVDKRGFFHRELADALEACEQVPEDQIYIIPIRLDACPVQERLSRFQCCDLFETGAMESLLEAIRNVARQKARRGNRVRW
ncbi:MAG: toll/interleukin-1 receptor domain-containing protein [bacterium]|nr:toll/interleukin-1 receptor domain-containing protein [bacterium]